MKKVLVLFSFSLLFLMACQAKQPSMVQKTSVPDQEIKMEESSADSTKTSQAPVFNGQYYSVTGKYGDEIVVVNKKHPLAATYAPGENPVAHAELLRLIADMKALGFVISDEYSGFRSYEHQATIYEQYVARDGKENADRYSARPGHSEHQSGLAFDLLDGSGSLLEEEEAAVWLKEHAHEYGFILRYLLDKEDVTGYMAESWHLRYIGQEAKDIYQSGLTLEEYFGFAGGDYED